MKKSSLLISLLMGLSITILGQTQISFFDNQVPALELERNGIVNIEGEDYLLEYDRHNFRVSTITDSIRVLYEVTDYPSDQNIHHAGGILNTRSGFIVEGEYLYELFYLLIRKRNILTGEIVAEYPSPYIDLNYQSEVEIVDGIIHMQINRLRELAFFNTITEEYTVLEYDPKYTFRSGNTYYSKDDEDVIDHGIIEYNAEDKTTKIIFEDEPNSTFGNNSNINGQKGLVFGDLYKTRFLNADTTFLLSCIFDGNLASELYIHETNDKYIALYNEENASSIKIYNKNDCSEYSTETIVLDSDGQRIKVFEPQILNGDYLIIEVYDSGSYEDTPASVNLLDKTDLSLTLIDDEHIGYISESNFFRSGDEIYFAGHEPYDIYFGWNLYSFNLATKEFNLNLEGSYYLPISFGNSDSESTYLIPRNENTLTNIYKFYSGDNKTLVPRTANPRNEGIASIKHLAVDEEKLVFKFEKGIYLADNNNNSSDKTSLITEADNTSEMIIKDGILKGLINNNGGSYWMLSNLYTNQLTVGNLPEFVPLVKESVAFSDYVFANSLFDDKKYFDFETGALESIPINGDIESIARSNNHLLLVSVCAAGHCLTSFKDGTFTNLEKSFEFEPKIFSKGNGEFMVLENYADDENRLSIIKQDGSVGDEIIVVGQLRYDNTEKIAVGPLSALMFYNSESEELEIVMHRYEKFHRSTIPFNYGGVAPVLWYKAGNSIIVQSDDNDEPGIYVVTLGKGTKKLDLIDVGQFGYRLQFASHEDGILSFYVRSVQNGLEIVQYDIESEDLTYTSDGTSQLVFDPYSQNEIYRISSTEHFVTFTQDFGYGTSNNSELYSFDSSTPSLEALPDLNQRNQVSNPHRFIESTSHLYFIARTPLDNSYQLYSKQKDAISAVNNPTKMYAKINVHPNPSSDAISIDSDADVVTFINAQGQLLRSIRRYNRNQKIDISGMPSGLYFLEIRNGGEVSPSVFVKH